MLVAGRPLRLSVPFFGHVAWPCWIRSLAWILAGRRCFNVVGVVGSARLEVDRLLVDPQLAGFDGLDLAVGGGLDPLPAGPLDYKVVPLESVAVAHLAPAEELVCPTTGYEIEAIAPIPKVIVREKDKGLAGHAKVEVHPELPPIPQATTLDKYGCGR